MKAKTAIYLLGGPIVKVSESFEDVSILYAQMQRAQPGSQYQFTRVTDHGSQKRVTVPPGAIIRLEEL